MQKAGLLFISFLFVFQYLVIAAALMVFYPIISIALVMLGGVGLLIAQVIFDRLKNSPDEQPQQLQTK